MDPEFILSFYINYSNLPIERESNSGTTGIVHPLLNRYRVNCPIITPGSTVTVFAELI